MKKLIVFVFLLMTVITVMGQNSNRVEGVSSTITVIPSSTAASTGSTTLPYIPGLADWSLQIMPIAGGTLTSDSVYATVQLFVSNSLGTAVWSEPKAWITGASATAGAGTVWEYYPCRDTIDNTTVALSPGLLMQDRGFLNSRIKVVVNRPKSTDSVNYKVYYVFKYPQTNPQR